MSGRRVGAFLALSAAGGPRPRPLSRCSNRPGRHRRQLLLVALFHGGQIRIHHAPRVAAGSVLHPRSSQIASSQKRSTRLSECVTSRIVRPLRRNSANLSRHLCVNAYVADRQDLVHEQHVRIHVDRDREPEPHVQVRRVQS